MCAQEKNSCHLHVRLMSAALLWLGGAEDEVLLNRIVATLVGRWTDREGSIYILTQGGTTKQQGRNIHVLTLIPNGESRYTKNLIRCIPTGKDEEVGLFWGRWPQSRFVGVFEKENEERITWRRGGCRFRWRKLQSACASS